MGTLNEILSLMYKMDKGYRKASSLNESSFGYNLIMESRESDADKRSILELQKLFGNDWDENQINENFKKFKNKFYHDDLMKKNAIMRLEPLICRIAFSECGFGQPNVSFQAVERLKSILDFLYVNGADFNLAKQIPNDMLYTLTFSDLENMYGEYMRNSKLLKRKKIEGKTYIKNTNYNIIGPLDYETAHQYGNLSCPDSKLCYTQSKETWNFYTSNGFNNAYVALVDGWEQIKPIHEESDGGIKNPYDTYGLSMIFVFVDGEGELKTCNVRWNHDATFKHPYSVDFAMDEEMISNTLGVNFYAVFKPNTLLRDKLAEVEKLKNVSNKQLFPACKKLFDEAVMYNERYIYIRFNTKYNLLEIKSRELILPCWCDFVSRNVNSFGFTTILEGEKENIFNIHTKKLVSDEWFDCVVTCSEYTGSFIVSRNKHYNYIGRDGEYIFDRWFERADDFYEQRALVQIDGKYNFLKTDFTFLIDSDHLDDWFDDARHFQPYVKRAIIAKRNLDGDKKWNLIDENGKIISKMWFDKIYPFDIRENIAEVFCGNKCNFIDENGELIYKHPVSEWFDYSNNIFAFGHVSVKRNDKYYLLYLDGNLKQLS